MMKIKEQKNKIMGCQLEGLRNECKTCIHKDKPDICEGIREANSWAVYYEDEIPITIKDQVKKILYDTKHEGISKLVAYLEFDTDFFKAPASTSHHLARKGGLAEHSLSVYEAMVRLNETFRLDIPLHQIVITGLLHDLCKTNYYNKEFEPIPNIPDFSRSTGKWVVEDKLPLGHGEKSLYLVSKYLNLSDAKAAAIRWHMGCWTSGVTTDHGLAQSFNSAVEKYPLVSLLISADYISSRLLEDE